MTDGAGDDPFHRSSFDELEELVEVGRGGFAVVFRASQPRFGRTVAVKVIDSAADDKAIERFERECAAMGMLSSHPNIVTVFDAGVRESGEPYLVMEYMPEGSFDVRLRNGPLSWHEVVDVGVKLAGALETAHDATILHRDVKPANVLTSSFGEPCLGDFGLARFHGGNSTAGVVSATLLHAPPEILAGVPATPRSDLYSLGSTLHTLLTGRAPFHREEDESVLPLFSRIANEPIPDLRPLGVPATVCAALEQAMAKQPADRQASLAAFAEQLRHAQRAEGLSPTVLRVNQSSAEAAAKTLLPDPSDAQGTVSTATPGAVPVPGRGDGGETISVAAPVPAPRAGAAPPPPPPQLRPPPPTAPPVATRKKRTGLVVTAVVGGVLVLAVGALLLLVFVLDDGERAIDTPAAPATVPDLSTIPPSPGEAADELVAEVNGFRDDEGLPPLDVDEDLTVAARVHANEIAASGRLTQTDLEELGASLPGQFTILGENLLSGTSVEDLQQSSIDTPAQRDNLLDPAWDSIGVGIAFSDDGSTFFAVEYFGQAAAG